MDVIALFSKGINYSVASLGTALTPTQAKLLKRYGEEIYIAYDSDAAGSKATLRAVDIISEEEIKAKVIQLPKGMDPDDYIQKAGKIRFERLLKEALTPINYKIKINKKKFDISKTEEKILFTKEISRVIRDLKSPIEEDVYIEKISKDTGISKEAIEREVRGGYKSRPKPKTSNIQQQTSSRESQISRIKSAHTKAEVDLIKIMIMDKQYFKIINSKILKEGFSNPQCKKLYDFIKLSYDKKDVLDIKEILDEAESMEIDKDISEELKEGFLEYKPTNIEIVIDDLTRTLMVNNLEEKRKAVIKEIEDLDKNPEKMQDNEEYSKELFIELTNLNKEIKSIRYK